MAVMIVLAVSVVVVVVLLGVGVVPEACSGRAAAVDCKHLAAGFLPGLLEITRDYSDFANKNGITAIPDPAGRWDFF